ncbi:hypothetical protein ACHAW6_001243 [Cyclotella cf. meneghiniana]
MVMSILLMFETHGRFACQHEVILPETNKFINGEPLQLSEFYKWLGCQLFMACFIGISDYRKWGSPKTIDLFTGALFRLNSYMSLACFKSIDGAIHYTDKSYPEFQDKFYNVHQFIDGFNQHMANNSFPSWLNCLDGCMNIWLNKYCPGFMVVVCKPPPFGNEYSIVMGMVVLGYQSCGVSNWKTKRIAKNFQMGSGHMSQNWNITH